MGQLGKASSPGGWDRITHSPAGLVDLKVPAVGTYQVNNSSGLFCSIADMKLFRDHTDYMELRGSILFQFALQGSYRIDVDGGSHYHHGEGRGVALAFSHGRCSRSLSADSRVRHVGILLPIPALVERFGFDPSLLADDVRGVFDDASKQPFVQDFHLTRRQIEIVEQLLELPYSGLLGERFREAKVTELICLAVDKLMALNARRIVLSSRERERYALERAAQILATELDEGISITALARRVGLNRNKLSEGFRERFGITPGAFARRARLERARKLVLTTDLSIFEIACETGFQSQSSFCRAYHLLHGRPPLKDRASRDEI